MVEWIRERLCSSVLALLQRTDEKRKTEGIKEDGERDTEAERRGGE